MKHGLPASGRQPLDRHGCPPSSLRRCRPSWASAVCGAGAPRRRWRPPAFDWSGCTRSDGQAVRGSRAPASSFKAPLLRRLSGRNRVLARRRQAPRRAATSCASGHGVGAPGSCDRETRRRLHQLLQACCAARDAPRHRRRAVLEGRRTITTARRSLLAARGAVRSVPRLLRFAPRSIRAAGWSLHLSRRTLRVARRLAGAARRRPTTRGQGSFAARLSSRAARRTIHLAR
jgi:hypothetical protein